MTSRFTVRRLAALVLSVVTSAALFWGVVIGVIVIGSDKASDDDPPLFSTEVPVAAPTEPAATPTEPTVAPTAPPAPTIAVPTPAPTAEAAPPPAPTDYSEVGPAYAAARAALLAVGREVGDALRTGDAATTHARFSEELQAALPEHELQAALEELRGNRVHFRVHAQDAQGETNAFFDGRLSDGTISGSFTFFNGVPGTFSLERPFSAEPAATLVGRWEGSIVIGDDQLGIAVAFEGEGEALRGTIDVPDAGLFAVALEDVGYEPSVETGELFAESVLPASPDLGVYESEQTWGPSTLVLAVFFDRNGTIVDIAEPFWRIPLPPDPALDFTSETEFRLPFDGIWLVTRGGPTELQSHHVVARSQRHGYDLVIWKNGGAYRGDGTRNEDYWAWKQPVLAPADGTIVAVLDGLEDNTPGVLKPEPHPAGNNVVLKTGAAEFVHIGHLQQGSIRVKEGDRVTTGTVLGLTGNSGNSSGPHIHIHVQDEQDFFSPTATGLPLPFTNYHLNGEPVSAVEPVQGDLIQHAEQ